MPDINEFLDNALADDGGDAIGDVGSEQVQTSEALTGSDEGGADDALPAGDKFDRSYVEKLRRESAGYRERAKRYQEAFDGYDDVAVDEWLDYAKSLRADPRGTAQRMADLANGILDAYNDPADPNHAAAVKAVEDGSLDEKTAKLMTEDDYKRLRAAERVEDERRDTVRKIESQARDLGYEVGSKSYKRLLSEAMELPDGSIAKAHENLQAERQSIIDAYVAEKGQPAGRRLPSQMGTASTEPATELKTWGDSRKALEDFLSGQF